MNIRILISFLFYVLVFHLVSYSQEPIYKHFGVDEGLPSSQVYDVYQSEEGYIWFATDKGISKFNGYEFETFDTNDGLPGNVVLRFYPQKNGQIWAYTLHSKSLFYFNEKFNGFVNYKFNDVLNKELNPKSIIKSLFVDELNTLHIGGTLINGVLSINDNGEINRKYSHKDYFKNDGLYNGVQTRHFVLNTPTLKNHINFTTIDEAVINKSFSVRRIGSSHTDALWIAKNKKAIFMDGESLHIVEDANKKTKIIKNQYKTLGIKVIDSAHFFVGYQNGGAKIIDDKGAIKQIYLEGKSVTNFLIDHEGGYWFTTLNSGVYYAKKPSITSFQTPNNFTSTHVNSLAKKNNELLIGYKNGGFAKLGANRKYQLKRAVSNSNPAYVEYDAIKDKMYLFENNELSVNNDVLYSLYLTKFSEPTLTGTVFLSSGSTVLNLKNNKSHRFSTRVLDITIYKKDTIISTPFGVYKKNNENLLSLSAKSKLLGYRSDDIDLSSKENTLYIATQGAGIVVYGESIYNISKKDGLTSNVVKEIHVENDATIYAITNKGLNRIVFSDDDYTITNFDKNDGLLSNEVEDVEVINDTLWVGTKDGLCVIPKKVLDKNKINDIYLKFKKIKVNDSIYENKIAPKLKYYENKITFLVEGISFASNYNLEYHYRLKEIDDKWSVTKNRNISFPNLKEGKYTFQVSACVGNNCFSDNYLEYSFTILPPFWKSWWFYTLCFLTFCGLVYLFFKIRVLTYNKDVVREFIRLLIKRLKRDEIFLEIRMNGEDLKIFTKEILFIKSSGNYLDIVCTNKTYTIRCKIGDFIATTPDALEYLRVHRSYIIRIDKVTGKSKKTVTINNHIIPVGETFIIQLDNIHF